MRYRFIFFIAIVVILMGTTHVHAADHVPVPTDGVLDLSSKDESEVVELRGDWRLYPRRFVSPNDIHLDVDYVLIDVPTTWEYTIYQVPHFINNALSNAIYLIENKPEQAKRFLIELSNLMVNKYNFNLKNSVRRFPLGRK